MPFRGEIEYENEHTTRTTTKKETKYSFWNWKPLQIINTYNYMVSFDFRKIHFCFYYYHIVLERHRVYCQFWVLFCKDCQFATKSRFFPTRNGAEPIYCVSLSHAHWAKYQVLVVGWYLAATTGWNNERNKNRNAGRWTSFIWSSGPNTKSAIGLAVRIVKKCLRGYDNGECVFYFSCII